MQIQGTQIRACPDCIQARDEHRIHIARNQPAFRVQPGTELADAFERIDDGLEQDGKGGRPWR
jgi:tellurite resistance protein